MCLWYRSKKMELSLIISKRASSHVIRKLWNFKRTIENNGERCWTAESWAKKRAGCACRNIHVCNSSTKISIRWFLVPSVLLPQMSVCHIWFFLSELLQAFTYNSSFTKVICIYFLYPAMLYFTGIIFII